MDSERKKLWPRRQARTVAEEIKALLLPYVERIEIAGSLRREKSHIGDIELLFIPKTKIIEVDLEGNPVDKIDEAELMLNRMLSQAIICKRLSKTGHAAWGALNKLAVHVASGIPVDFFSTTADNWPVSLFIRTGGKRMNLMVTMAANKMGYSLEAYGKGFRCLAHPAARHDVISEEEIFKFVGLPFLEPCLRP